jgi:hypothetical protein
MFMGADEENRAEKVEAEKQDQLKKQKEGKGEWKDSLASVCQTNGCKGDYMSETLANPSTHHFRIRRVRWVATLVERDVWCVRWLMVCAGESGPRRY